MHSFSEGQCSINLNNKQWLRLARWSMRRRSRFRDREAPTNTGTCIVVGRFGGSRGSAEPCMKCSSSDSGSRQAPRCSTTRYTVAGTRCKAGAHMYNDMVSKVPLSLCRPTDRTQPQAAHPSQACQRNTGQMQLQALFHQATWPVWTRLGNKGLHNA